MAKKKAQDKFVVLDNGYLEDVNLYSSLSKAMGSVTDDDTDECSDIVIYKLVPCYKFKYIPPMKRVINWVSMNANK